MEFETEGQLPSSHQKRNKIQCAFRVGNCKREHQPMKDVPGGLVWLLDNPDDISQPQVGK